MCIRDSSYIVMELLRGPTLASVIAEGRMDPMRACRIAAQIAHGLQAVHDLGIVHRDLKPENVFLLEQDGKKDNVKIVDFGIAKATGEAPIARKRNSQEDISLVSEQKISAQTMPGTLMGTPAYLAPEMALGHEVDFRVDQYALGVILYETVSYTHLPGSRAGLVGRQPQAARCVPGCARQGQRRL